MRAQTDEHWLRGCYFQIKGTHYYITHGFNKNTNKTPSKEISRAEKIRQDFLSQNRRNEK
ncbi:type II toxin-antitoxin system RelE/ParE family toxin [Desemzia incerta]|uniref:type II toxin-antitoxin system RelE/ParE family toxin n=1 Tax=Desemzia incerta TaxID=82801 RepID=UPI003D08E54A